jgi:hypothetical protein
VALSFAAAGELWLDYMYHWTMPFSSKLLLSDSEADHREFLQGSKAQSAVQVKLHALKHVRPYAVIVDKLHLLRHVSFQDLSAAHRQTHFKHVHAQAFAYARKINNHLGTSLPLENGFGTARDTEERGMKNLIMSDPHIFGVFIRNLKRKYGNILQVGVTESDFSQGRLRLYSPLRSAWRTLHQVTALVWTMALYPRSGRRKNGKAHRRNVFHANRFPYYMAWRTAAWTAPSIGRIYGNRVLSTVGAFFNLAVSACVL